MQRTISDSERDQFIEQLGLLVEEAGVPRMSGRVLGALLICDERRLSFTELVERLHASKGSISASTRLLIQLGLIDRLSEPGDRRDYFALRPDAWTQFLRHRVRTLSRLRDLAGQTLPLLQDRPAGHSARLRAMHEFYSWWEQQAEQVLARWEARVAAAESGGTFEGTDGSPR